MTAEAGLRSGVVLALVASMLALVAGTGPVAAVVPGQVGLLTFASQRDGNAEIYVMNADGTSQTRITHNSIEDGQPVFSPDGRKIAFESNRDGNAEIYVMNADGTSQTRLTNAVNEDYAPAFSPDGQKIAFEAYRDGNPEIYVMNADGTGQTRITNNPASDSQPVFSPDGQTIIFDSGRTGASDIYAMDADGSNPTRLTTSAGIDGSPAVSPDGTKIAFYSNRDGDGEIYVMNADGTIQTRLTNNDGADTEPAYSPDGQKIAFIRWGTNSDPDVFAMNPNGSSPVNLTAITGSDNSPDWQSAPPNPTVTKSRTEASVNPGETIHYDIAVHNNAAIVLTGVTLTDPNAICATPPASIAIAATVHLSCTHVAALADLGTYTNTATVDTEQTAAVESNLVSTMVESLPGVSGTVTEAGSGSPVAGSWVAVLRTSDFSIAGGGVANGSGDYSVSVPAGSYYLYVIDPGGAHTGGFHGPPTTVMVTAGNTVDADPVMVSTRGEVTATVTETGTGTPIAGVWGLALSASTANTGAPKAAVVANGSGQLTLPGLGPGSHFVGFIDPTGAHATRFYPNSPNVPDATPVAVAAGGSTVANASLPAQTPVGTGSVISGAITEQGTGDPLAGARVIALRAADYAMVRGALSNASGVYSLNVAAGAYKLAILDSTGRHNMEWYDNLPSTGLAAAASVTAPAVANARLDPNTGTMAGTIVDDPSGTPIAGAWVLAIGPTGLVGGAITAANGTYAVMGLPPGTYRATIIDPNGGRTQEYFDGSPDYTGASVFAVAAGDTTTIDADLAQPGPPAFINAWGSHGTANSQFQFPWAVAAAASGDVYVADTFNHRIQKFTSTGAYVTQWGAFGTGNGQFNHPTGVAVDPSGNIYVTDHDNHRVQKFNSTGTYLTQWGANGTGNGQFIRPVGIAVDTATGNVYVGDYNNRIQKFSSTGTYLTQFATTGNGNGQLNDPAGVAVDHSGNVYVSDYGNDRVEKFSSTGTYLTKWGATGTGNGQFQSPYGITVDPQGNVLVADAVNHRIQRFTATGSYLTQWGAFGTGNGQFNLPHSVAVGPSGNIYVADQTNHRVQRFASS